MRPASGELPHLQIDSDGRPWLLVRNVTKRGPAGRPRYFPMWEIHVTRYDGSRWSELVRVRQSSGRNDMSPATALDADGRIWGIWATDMRSAKSGLPQYGRVMVSPLGSSPGRKTLALQPWTPAAVDSVDRIHPNEAEQVARIRSYRVEAGGKAYFIYRGDTHRHTDISLDGGGDGGLLDAYRYARDAAAMDFLEPRTTTTKLPSRTPGGGPRSSPICSSSTAASPRSMPTSARSSFPTVTGTSSSPSGETTSWRC